MDVSDRRCPAPDALAALASGAASPSERAALLAHVDRCDACLEALARLASDDRGEPSVALDFPSVVSSIAADHAGHEDPTTDARLRRGQLLGDRYVVLDELGRGGMGRVYLAHDNALRREVAVKLVTAGGQGAEREARSLAAVRHPNVVSVFDVFNHAGRTFIAMEHVRGSTLRAWVRVPRARRAVVQRLLRLSAGLGATHAAGVIHGDVKPDNALVDEALGEAAKLADFGLAQLEGGRPLGATRAYLAPEQRDACEATVVGDLYSLAATWVACLDPTAAPPPGDPPDWRPRAAACRPRWARRPLARGLDPDPLRRPPTVAAFIAALTWARRRARAGLLALLLLLLAAPFVVDALLSHAAWQRCMAPFPLPPVTDASTGDETLLSAAEREMAAAMRRAGAQLCDAERADQDEVAAALARCLAAEAEAWELVRTRARTDLQRPLAFARHWRALRARIDAFRCLDGPDVIALSAALVRAADYAGVFAWDGPPDALDDAIASLRAAGLVAPLTDALFNRALRAAARSDPEAARRDYEAALLLAMTSRDAVREAVAWAHLGRLEAVFGADFAAARVALARARALAGPTPGIALDDRLLELQMLLDVYAGFPERAIEAFERVSASTPGTAPSARDPAATIARARLYTNRQGLVLLGHAYLALGRLDEAEAAYAAQLAERLEDEAPAPSRIAGGLHNLALVHEARGAREEARTLARQALALRLEHGGPDQRETLRVLATLARLEDADALRPTLARLVEAATRDHGPHHVEVFRARVDLAEAHGDAGACVEAADEAHAALAVGRAHGYEAGRFMVRALHTLAACALGDADRARARTHIVEAEAVPGRGLDHPATRARHAELTELAR